MSLAETLANTIADARTTLAAFEATIADKKAVRDGFIAEHRAIYEHDRALGKEIIDLQHQAAAIRAALMPPRG